MDKILQKKLTQIAVDNLLVKDTLERQYSDTLDFHDCAVWCIAKALEDAYNAGFKDGKHDKQN